MTQQQLELAVAEATGEPIAEIRRRGFGPLGPLDASFDPDEGEFGPNIVDWDELAEHRLSRFS